MEPIYVARDPHEKAMQRALIHRKPENYKLVREALEKAGRRDLIGYTKHCLIRPVPPRPGETSAGGGHGTGRKKAASRTVALAARAPKAARGTAACRVHRTLPGATVQLRGVRAPTEAGISNYSGALAAPIPHAWRSERIASTSIKPAMPTVTTTSSGVPTNHSSPMRYDPALNAKCSRIV